MPTMDTNSDEQYLKKINEFVQDEDKIVTFQWLSSNLNINVEYSKQLLEKYVKEYKKDDLEVVYWLCGEMDGAYYVSLVKQNELDQKALKLTSVTSKFIYSVYKTNEANLKDLLVNIKSMEIVPGMLKSNSCVKRILKEKAALPEIKKTDLTKSKSLFNSIGVKSVKSSSALPSKSSENELKNASVPSKLNNASKGIAGFISNMPPKQKAKSEGQISNAEITKSQNKPFKESEIEETKNEINKNKTSVIIDSDDSEEEKRVPTNTEDEKPKRSSKTSVSKRKRETSNSNNKKSKQRKRIVEHNDSDSDDIFGSDEKDEFKEPAQLSDEEEIVFKPKVDLGPKNKRRKLVNQTYTDEEGYIMTRKEWVYVDGESEDEKNEETDSKNVPVKDVVQKTVKKEVENNGHLKTKGGKGKNKKLVSNQSTLMSFFKKA